MTKCDKKDANYSISPETQRVGVGRGFQAPALCVCVTHDLTFFKKINKPQEISNGKANTVKKSPMLTSEGFDLFCCSSSMKVTSASPDL